MSELSRREREDLRKEAQNAQRIWQDPSKSYEDYAEYVHAAAPQVVLRLLDKLDHWEAGERLQQKGGPSQLLLLLLAIYIRSGHESADTELKRRLTEEDMQYLARAFEESQQLRQWKG